MKHIFSLFVICLLAFSCNKSVEKSNSPANEAIVSTSQMNLESYYKSIGLNPVNTLTDDSAKYGFTESLTINYKEEGFKIDKGIMAMAQKAEGVSVVAFASISKEINDSDLMKAKENAIKYLFPLLDQSLKNDREKIIEHFKNTFKSIPAEMKAPGEKAPIVDEFVSGKLKIQLSLVEESGSTVIYRVTFNQK